MQSDAEQAAKLDKPGAGIPFMHGLMLRWFVGPVVANMSDWNKSSGDFVAVNAKVLKAARKLTDAEMSVRVLVPSQHGLEDSSRYWSAAMVLEHLVIVGTGMKKITISLSQGIVPPIKADTALVKPKGALSPQEALKNFEDYAANTVNDIERDVKDRRSKAQLPHPWFGPFTAHQWHWLLTGHSVIHLGQLRAIVERLKPSVK